VQSQGGNRQGNANPVLYRMGNAQFSGGSPIVFHDVVSGDNSVPGAAGFSASPGYDLSTGLGTVDASALVHAWTAFAVPPRTVLPPSEPRPVRVHTRPPA
jgi:hypothetical protein